MTLLECTYETLSNDTLNKLRTAVYLATEPERMGGASPYHFTFWYDLAARPRNTVEEVVQGNLRQHVPETVRQQAIGVEWWLGRLSAPYAANFEFGVHRDFGEHPDTDELESPLLSSVFYLTTVDDGPLTVFPGLPNLQDEAKEYVLPQENLFVKFPGHLWHAVLSRQEVLGVAPSLPEHRLRLTVLVNWWVYRPGSEASAPMKLVAADYDGTRYPELRSAVG